jgi:hypothetical protein
MGKLWVPEAPHLLLRPTRQVELPSIPRIGIEGIYTVEVVDAASGKVKDSCRKHNVVLTNAFEKFQWPGHPVSGNANNIANAIHYCVVGSDGTNEDISQTHLLAELGRQIVSQRMELGTLVAGPPRYWRVVNKYVFPQAAANGTIREVGTSWEASSANAPTTTFSRARLRNPDNSPKDLVKTSFDELHVTYEYRVYPPPAADTVLVQSIKGVNVTITGRPVGLEAIQSWGGYQSGGSLFGIAHRWGEFHTFGSNNRVWETAALPDYLPNPVPAGTSADCTGITFEPYLAGSYERTVNLVWGTTVANWASGFGLITVKPGLFMSPVYAFSLSPKVIKLDTERFDFSYQFSWGRP